MQTITDKNEGETEGCNSRFVLTSWSLRRDLSPTRWFWSRRYSARMSYNSLTTGVGMGQLS